MQTEILLAEIIAGIVAMYGLYTLNKLILANKLLAAEQRLRSKIANFERNYGDIRDNPRSVISDAIGDIGLEGLLNQFGIDPAILKNPMVKGIIEKYAPRIIDQIGKKTGGNEQQTLL